VASQAEPERRNELIRYQQTPGETISSGTTSVKLERNKRERRAQDRPRPCEHESPRGVELRRGESTKTGKTADIVPSSVSTDEEGMREGKQVILQLL